MLAKAMSARVAANFITQACGAMHRVCHPPRGGTLGAAAQAGYTSVRAEARTMIPVTTRRSA